MSRAKLFIENFFIYGFINVLNKIIPLLLLPVITRLMPDPSDFGVFTMFTLIIGFGTPLAVLGLYDAMFREYFEKEDQDYRYRVTTTAQRLVLVSSLIISIILVVFNAIFSKIFFGTNLYGNIVILAAIALFLSANTSPIQAPTRIQNKRKVFLISGLLHSGGLYLISILLLYVGFSYYGLIFSNIITAVILLLFFWILNKNFFLLGKFDVKVVKELLKIGLPLLPTFLIYWIYNSMDRIMITNMLGTAELGIYAIGAKISSISLFIYTAFAGGWQYFAFSTMKDKDQVRLNSKVFEYLGVISFISLIMLYPIIKHIFSLLFTGDYIFGYIVVPYLYLSPLLLMLFQIVGNQFLVIKKSYWSTICLSLGAIINVILNIYLINKIGIEGAAISTLSGYVITLIIVCIITTRMDLLILSKRFVVISLLTFLYIIGIRLFLFDNLLPQIVVSVFMIALFVSLYRLEVSTIIKKIKIGRAKT